MVWNLGRGRGGGECVEAKEGDGGRKGHSSVRWRWRFWEFSAALCRKWRQIETNESAKPNTQTAADGGPEGLFFHSNPQGAIRQKSIDRWMIVAHALNSIGRLIYGSDPWGSQSVLSRSCLHARLFLAVQQEVVARSSEDQSVNAASSKVQQSCAQSTVSSIVMITVQ